MMDEEDLLRRLPTMQLIAIALPAGAVVFAGVAFLIVANRANELMPPWRW